MYCYVPELNQIYCKKNVSVFRFYFQTFFKSNFPYIDMKNKNVDMTGKSTASNKVQSQSQSVLNSTNIDLTAVPKN